MRDCKTGYVSHVFDGDTIRIRSKGIERTIRLYGIDTPEAKQSFSQNAKTYLQSLILFQTITYVPLYFDDYDRLVAHVYLQNQNINQLLVEKGFAWVHIYFCYQNICEDWKRIQKISKSNKIGLWAEKNPTPPWVWKKRKKEK